MALSRTRQLSKVAAARMEMKLKSLGRPFLGWKVTMSSFGPMVKTHQSKNRHPVSSHWVSGGGPSLHRYGGLLEAHRHLVYVGPTLVPSPATFPPASAQDPWAPTTYELRPIGPWVN